MRDLYERKILYLHALVIWLQIRLFVDNKFVRSKKKKTSLLYVPEKNSIWWLRLLARWKQCMSSPVSLASISWNSHLTVGWKSPLTSALELRLFKRRAILPWNRIIARRNLHEIRITPNTQHASQASAVSRIERWKCSYLEPAERYPSLSRVLLHRAASLPAFIWAQTLSLLTLATKQRFHCPASLKKWLFYQDIDQCAIKIQPSIMSKTRGSEI